MKEEKKYNNDYIMRMIEDMSAFFSQCQDLREQGIRAGIFIAKKRRVFGEKVLKWAGKSV